MARLRGVVIGCGAIAREHLAAVSEIPNAEIAAICDISPARAEATAEHFHIEKWYSDHQKLLAEIRPDLVHITTPPASHFAIAESCLTAGLSVLCEKPIAIDHQQFIALKQIASEHSCLLLENQNFRFHSAVQRIQDLIVSGNFGEVIDVGIWISIDLNTPSSPYVDANAPHFSSVLRGGVAGDFLPHVAYLVQMFTGRTLELRTAWDKRAPSSPFSADEFRALIKGERATASVAFSGNAQPNGFWIRVTGTQMHAEANLFESPRLTLRRLRSGERSVMTLLDGMIESRDLFRDSVAGFWRKLAGKTAYDGLSEFIARVYRSLETGARPPVSLDEVEASSLLVDRLTTSDNKL